MLNPETLTPEGIYHISGEHGEWHFLEIMTNKRYKFWRWAIGQKNRKVTTTLSREAVRRKVWEQVNKLDLSKLEAFRGE